MFGISLAVLGFAATAPGLAAASGPVAIGPNTTPGDDNNDVGFKVENTGNFAARNTARNLVKNYQIVANNRVGTIVVPTLSKAIDGNSGGGSGTLDPWSNIAH